MESLKWAWRKARGALSNIGSISFSGTDRRLFGHLSWSFDFFNDAGNQLSMSQTELQRRYALEQDLEAGATVTAQAELQPPSTRAPTPDLEAVAEDREVSNSSGGGEGRAGRGRGPTAAAEEARILNASNSKIIGELAVKMLGCMGIYSTIYGDEQLQRLHPSLYFPLLITFLACGAYASLYSVFYALTKPTAGEGEGGEERELVKREWLKVALTCTGSALSFRVALGLY